MGLCGENKTKTEGYSSFEYDNLLNRIIKEKEDIITNNEKEINELNQKLQNLKTDKIQP